MGLCWLGFVHDYRALLPLVVASEQTEARFADYYFCAGWHLCGGVLLVVFCMRSFRRLSMRNFKPGHYLHQPARLTCDQHIHSLV
jgi:hypothetical protein